MLPDEIKATGKLVGDAIAGPAALARDVHRAVSERTFGVLGVIGAPARLGHDAISKAVYRSVHSAIGLLPRRGGVALAQLAPPGSRALAESAAGSVGLGALNGAIGDRLDRDHRHLALRLTIRHGGEDLPAEPADLAERLPEASGKLAIFVHGLCETDAAWHLLPVSARRAGRASYGSRLRDEHGYTPLYVRYNTGLRVSENGQQLGAALEQLVAAWPVAIEEIVLVGHSMGGLVGRSACHYGARTQLAWADRVRQVICLGTPHLGAPLERAANVGGWALTRLPETRPFAQLVNGRSAGIKDLRYGSVLEEDWSDCDPDEYLTDRCQEAPFLEDAAYYFVGATIARDPESRLGRIVGDALVQYPSASGQGPRRRIPFEIENGIHLGGVNHIELLNHPAVYEQISGWLQAPSAGALQQRG
jgi:pimeloyl-ACP methyl ester carboxylesterase